MAAVRIERLASDAGGLDTAVAIATRCPAVELGSAGLAASCAVLGSWMDVSAIDG